MIHISLAIITDICYAQLLHWAGTQDTTRIPRLLVALAASSTKCKINFLTLWPLNIHVHE